MSKRTTAQGDRAAWPYYGPIVVLFSFCDIKVLHWDAPALLLILAYRHKGFEGFSFGIVNTAMNTDAFIPTIYYPLCHGLVLLL